MARMNRDAMLERCRASQNWDVLIIGGGATGLGAAVDAASRGFKTLLLEQSDFAKGTSSRSTKLIHGGLRYLRQGNVSLVLEALQERGILCQNAPHLVHPLGFLVPLYHWWEGPFYGVGLKVYDLLAGKLGLKPSHSMSLDETLQHLPTLETAGLQGSVLYFDGQFDDARLALTLAQTAVESGAVVVNYMRVEGLLKENGLVVGVEALDLETQQRTTLRARTVINATGVFADAVRKLDEPTSSKLIAPSQGVHLVLSRDFWPGDEALLIPHTDDGRLLFFVPWHQHLVIGTTDTPVETPSLEPRPMSNEVEFLLKYAARYLRRKPSKRDVLSMFAGLRPLVKAGDSANTAALSRDHTIVVADSGLITIAGGKWTTYRKMAEDVVDKAIVVGHLPEAACRTATLRLHGYTEASNSVYGSEEAALAKLVAASPELGRPLHTRLPYRGAEVVWAARSEMARTVEDVLARRTRALFLDAAAAIEMAPSVAELLGKELGKSTEWQRQEVEAFRVLARGYLPSE